MNGREASGPSIVIFAGGSGAPRAGKLDALTPVFFRPMMRFVLETASAIPHRSLAVIAGSEEGGLREECRDFPRAMISLQEPPLDGPGAARAVESVVDGRDGDVLALYADRVLLTPASLLGLLSAHAESGAACTAATAAGTGAAYCFRLPELLGTPPRGAGRGCPLEDAAAALAAAGRGTADYALEDPDEALAVGDHHALWKAETILRARLHRGLMLRGVALRDPASSRIDPRCRIEPGVVIEGGTTLMNSAFEAGVVVESGCRIIDSEIAAGTRVRQGTTIEKSRVGKRCVLGPYANLRPGTRLGDEVRIGNFVETKNAAIGTGTKVSHLSYVGDASVGRNVNIGCGFITCNFD
ncbi:MAG TPA: NTP transferase domain-containing protein, partial [Elusimicrobiota bacterium]|nr:NTP transferase domain-containing protein [Elusimicrobiota bacterium]